MLRAKLNTTPKQSQAVIRQMPHRNSERIGISTSSGLQIIWLKDICYCQAQGNYCSIFLNDGDHMMVSKPLKAVEQFLPAAIFARVHQSYIVRRDTVTKIGEMLTLLNGKEIAISRSRRAKFLAEMKAEINIV